MKKVITNNEKETIGFANKLAKHFKGGDIVGMVGNLGAGKTVFTKGVADSLGINEVISSPTFVYLKVYEVKNHKSIKFFCHIDAYRLESSQELVNIGALEYINNPEVLTMIEWADKVLEIIPLNKYTQIDIKYKGEKREITIK